MAAKGRDFPEVANWINNQKAKPGVTFSNVKTHKVGNPLRLITLCCGTPIENLSTFNEFYLQTPLVSYLLSSRTPQICSIELKKLAIVAHFAEPT